MSKQLGIINIPVRFFIYEFDKENEENQDTDNGFIEVSEAHFLTGEGTIEYERHTVFANGVSQICLTKNPFI